MTALAKLGFHRDGEAIVGSIAGEIDISNATDLGAALEGAVPPPAIGLVLDLSQATYIDSAGVHLLFRLGARLTRRRQQLRVVVPETAAIRRVVNLAGVHWTVPRDGTVGEALVNLRAEISPKRGEESWVSGPDAPYYYDE